MPARRHPPRRPDRGRDAVGGQIALRLSHTLPTVIALTGGVVVAVALFDVLPEGIENVGDPSRATALVAVGFLAFFFAERALVLHHRDDPDEARAHHRVGVFGALGLSVHSFIDGLGIGLAFGLDATTGFLVFIAVISHDFADGLNTVSFILSQSGDRRQATRWLRIDAIAPLLGAIVGSLLTVSDHDPRLHPLPLQRLLHLHGRDRPAPRGPRPRFLAESRADRVGLRADLRDHPARRGLSRRSPP